MSVTPAVNILEDVTVTMEFSATDLGGGETYAGPLTVKIDKLTVSEKLTSADHGTGQDKYEFHRGNKASWDITVETKLYSSAILAAVRENDLASLVATALDGLGVNCSGGLIVGVDADYAGPSTLKFSLKPRGEALTFE